MYRLSKYGFYIILVIGIAVLVSSCNPSKKAMVAAKPPVNHNTLLTRNQQYELTATYFDGSKEKVLGNYKKAIEEFMHCLFIDPNNAASNYEIADLYEYYKQPDTALVYAAKAAQIEPSNIWYEDLYAQCLQDKGRYKEMEVVYQGLIANHPDEVDYYYKLALAQIEAEEYENAADTYDKLEQKEGGFSEDLTKEKVKIYERVKDFPKAEIQIQRLIANDSANVQNYVELGDMYELENKNAEAFELYQKLEKRSPDNYSVHLALAQYYQEKNNDKKSLEELKGAFKQPEMDVESEQRILLGFNAGSNGHDSLQIEAIELCKLMVQAHPNDPAAHQLFGNFLYRQDSYKDARVQYRLTMSEDSSKFIVWNQLMGCDIQLTDFEDLANVTAGAIELFPDNPQSYLFNGIANGQKKKYNDAVSVLNKGIEYVVNNNPMLMEFYANLGDDYNSMKKYNASDSAYEEVLKIDPNNDNVLNNYSYYLSERDTNLAKAEQMSKKSNDLVANNGTYLDTYAWIFYKEGNYKDAKVWEDKALMYGGQKDAAVLDHYGDILYKNGDTDNAVVYWQKAKAAGLNTDTLNKKIQDKKLYDK